MSWLVAAACAHAAGIWLADGGWLGREAAFVAGLLLGGLACLARRSSTRGVLALGMLWCAGAASLDRNLELARRAPPGVGVSAADPSAHPAEGLVVEGRVASVRRFGPAGGNVRVRLVEVRCVRGDRVPPERIRIHLESDAPGAPGPLDWIAGDRVRAFVRLRPVGGWRNPGRRDTAATLAREGLAVRGRLTHPALWLRHPAEGLHVHWRRLVASRAASIEALRERGPGGALVAALALGDRDLLAPDSRARFARRGTAHLLAVSGLHLSLVAAGVFALSRRGLLAIRSLPVRDARGPAIAIALGAAAAYAALTGFGVPVRRALVLLVALVVALTTRRPGRRLAEPLAAAALWILIRDPAALFAPGAQLSFLATLGLGVWARRQGGRARSRWVQGGPVPRMVELADTRAVAALATAPVSIQAGLPLSPWALAANLVMVPWTALVLLPGSLAGVALAWATGCQAPLDVACALASMTLALVEAVESRLPGATPVAPSDPMRALLVAGIAWAALVQPSVALRALFVVSIALFVRHTDPPAIAPAPPRAVFLDVGHGDATLVQGRRANLLVDAGWARPGGADLGALVVAPALRALGVGRLDAVAVTHADLDHRGGVPAVLRAFEVGELWLPAATAGTPELAVLRKLARGYAVPVRLVRAEDEARVLGDLRIDVLAPPGLAIDPGLGENDASLVLRIVANGTRLLLPGDVESEGERRLLASEHSLRADILKLAHHGSRTSSTPTFLDAVGARRLVASAPCRGRFGLPHAEVRARLRDRKQPLHWTGRDGAVLISLDPALGFRSWGKSRTDCHGESAAPAQNAPGEPFSGAGR